MKEHWKCPSNGIKKHTQKSLYQGISTSNLRIGPICTSRKAAARAFQCWQCHAMEQWLFQWSSMSWSWRAGHGWALVMDACHGWTLVWPALFGPKCKSERVRTQRLPRVYTTTVGLELAKLDPSIFCRTSSQDMSSRPVFPADHEYGLRFCRGSIFLHDFHVQ